MTASKVDRNRPEANVNGTFTPKAKRPKTGGRQKGVPNKTTAEIRELARRFAPEAIASIVTLLRLSPTDQIRLAAAREILDRAHGKPSQSMEVIGVPTDPDSDSGPLTAEEFMRKYGMSEESYEKLKAAINKAV